MSCIFEDFYDLKFVKELYILTVLKSILSNTLDRGEKMKTWKNDFKTVNTEFFHTLLIIKYASNVQHKII